MTRSGGGRAGAEPGEVDPVLGSAAPQAEAGQDPRQKHVLGVGGRPDDAGWSGVEWEILSSVGLG